MKAMRALPHPDAGQIDLATVLEALSDPTRLAIVARLSGCGDGDPRCSDFLDLAGKTNLAYHFAKLRTAGVVATRIEGTGRFMSLRRADLDARFPGLLDAVIASVRRPAKAPAPRRGRRAAARA
jgi:DNA-binding transcriptional ArsR family regulator